LLRKKAMDERITLAEAAAAVVSSAKESGEPVS